MVEIKDLPINQIKPNPDQPRKFLDKIKLKELADSIKSKGLLEEILVRPKDKYFEIVHGERRWRACKLVGLKTIKAKIKSLSDEEAFELSLAENIQRENLNLEDEARAIKKLKDRRLTEKEVARRIGKTRDYVAKKLLYLRDLDRLDKLIAEGIVDKGEAEKFKEDVRRRTISPEVLREAVKTDWRWNREKILEKSPTVQKAREISRGENYEAYKQDEKEFKEKVWNKYKVVFKKKKEEYFSLLPPNHRHILNSICDRLFKTTFLSTEAFDLRKKWSKKFDITEEGLIAWGDEYIYQNSVDWDVFILWQEKGRPSIEKLIDFVFSNFKKIVEMENTKRQKLFESFEKEYKELFPDVGKVNINQILVSIPEKIWRRIHRSLELTFHPDRGGDPEVVIWVNRLSEGIKNLRDWK